MLIGVLTSSHLADGLAVAGQLRRPKQNIPSTSIALLLGAILGIIETLLLVLLAEPLLSLMGVKFGSPMLLPAHKYLTLRSLGAPPVLLSLAMQGVFRGFKDTRTLLYATVAGDVANIILDAILIFACNLGVSGAAIAHFCDVCFVIVCEVGCNTYGCIPNMLIGVLTSSHIADGLAVAGQKAKAKYPFNLNSIASWCNSWVLRCLLPAHKYLTLRSLGAPTVLLSLAMQGVFRGFKDTRTLLYATVAGDVANIILDAILIFACNLGVSGAAIAHFCDVCFVIVCEVGCNTYGCIPNMLIGVLTSSHIADGLAVAGQLRRPKQNIPSTSIALLLGAILGIIETLLLVLLAEPLLSLMGVKFGSPMLLPAHKYLTLRSLGAPTVLLSLAMQGVFRGFKDTRTLLYATVAGDVANIILDAILIFACNLGVIGAAIAHVIAATSFVTFALSLSARLGATPMAAFQICL
ncbi:hypothetical protein OSB04_013055 [Centaurea solstitialis]|uniref:Protein DETOXIFICATION n=1 Tax=Centaurea solstitialis TaxID=347529 RepID=A0AA38WR17_9ASTR|nr:hypothetical protein OSB04_013055 [Centaurea solstitialis]